ncbi:uncharacterized protein LOC114164725 isoform X2 [Vigna unguiculata]|uniref:uncharacterized protein LOC114164725 isoform X2 n=1 Tax=Vigna unguiculata TaxID=3917 RepID=UPI0010162882|nr:uncharacterized protein LOC114164725 isoform X2 [Vigna unguiculata]
MVVGSYSPKIQTNLAGKDAIEEGQSQSKLLSQFRPGPVLVGHTRKEEIRILASNPKADIENLEELLQEDNFLLEYGVRTRTVSGVDFEVEGKRYTEKKACSCFSSQFVE